MFDFTSRYFGLDKLKIVEDGVTIKYSSRRFLPAGEKMQVLKEVVIGENERLDQVTARELGDPEQFWKVADANNAMNPFVLTAKAGEKIRIPIP
jgi:hypothetical protein